MKKRKIASKKVMRKSIPLLFALSHNPEFIHELKKHGYILDISEMCKMMSDVLQ